MKKQLFDKNNKIYKAYMFWGDSDYFIEKYINNTINRLNIKNEDILKLYFDEYKYDLAYNHLSQNSLFSPINVALIKTNKKINKNEIKKILDLVDRFDNSFVIFGFLENIDMRDIAKLFKDNFVEVRFFKPNHNEAVSELINFANDFKLKIDTNSLLHLYNMHNQNLSLCIKDIEKLSILDTEISSKMIDYYCFGLGSVDVNELIFDFFNKKDIKTNLTHLLDEGYNEILLLRQLCDFATILIKILVYIRINGEFNIKEIFGFSMPPFIANRYQKVAMSYKLENILNVLDKLLDLELELKNGIIKDSKNYFLTKVVSL